MSFQSKLKSFPLVVSKCVLMKRLMALLLMILLHERTRAGQNIQVVEALNYHFKAKFQDEIERKVKQERTNAAKGMIDEGMSKDAIVRILLRSFQCTQDEAEDYYNIASDER
ncbi:MAG: hypothetical protein AB7S75_00115 [Desulfococcaceae bacterium]